MESEPLSVGMILLLQVGPLLSLLLITFFVGRYMEKQHIEQLRVRESSPGRPTTMTLRRPPPGRTVAQSGLVSDSVVISLDYFKRFVAGLKSLVGGRIGSYEPLLQRARREALLRMEAIATAQGYDAVINVRLETSRLASSRGDGKGTAGIEILAFGTGVRWDRGAA